MVNWTNTMATGLAARREFMTSQPSRTVVRRGGGGSGNRMHISKRQELEDQMLEAGRTKNKQAKADVEMTKARTKNLLTPKPEKEGRSSKRDKKSEKVDTQSKELKNIQKGLEIVSGLASSFTQKNYPTVYAAIEKTDVLPTGLMKTPREIKQMSPLELNAYKSEVQGYVTSDNKTLDKITKMKKREKKLQEKLNSAKLENKREQRKLNVEEDQERFEDAMEYLDYMYKTYGEDIPENKLDSYESAVRIAEGRFNEDVDETPEPPMNQEGGEAPSEITPELMDAFRERYPDKTDEEIIAAYEAYNR